MSKEMAQLMSELVHSTKVRQAITRFVVDSLWQAHQQHPACWAVHINTKRLIVWVGQLAVFVVTRQHVHIMLEEPQISYATEQQLKKQALQFPVKNYPVLASATDVKLRHTDVLSLLETLKNSHFILLTKAARTGHKPKRCRYHYQHMSTFIQYLQHQYEVPQPQYKNIESIPTTETILASPLDFKSIVERFKQCKLYISETSLRRYHLALQTQELVVLTGVSGTGKTWLTHAYAQAVNAEYLLVPVAPNWHSNEDLLGFYNPVRDHYQHSACSRFIQQAAAHYCQYGEQSRPYHLVLDEMNVARVEHYLAKLLSLMEVRRRGECVYIELSSEEQVLLSPNLMIIGTINRDASTQEFSDKVYDRTQLIELPVEKELLQQFMQSWSYGKELLTLWALVHPYAPFAFRTMETMHQYICVAVELGITWQQALDEQVMQKIYPKFNSLSPQFNQGIKQLQQFCQQHDLQLSLAKLAEIQRQQQEQGFSQF